VKGIHLPFGGEWDPPVDLESIETDFFDWELDENISEDFSNAVWIGDGQPYKEYLEKELDDSSTPDLKILPVEELLLGLEKLKIPYEYWNFLAAQYLTRPNQHTPSIEQAIRSGKFDVQEAEFVNHLQIYWKIVLATWFFENTYIKECFKAGYPSSSNLKPLKNLPYVGIRYSGPVPVQDITSQLYRFECFVALPDTCFENPYIETQGFRTRHLGFSHLTTNVCHGIPSRLVSSRLDTSHQL